MSRSFQTDSIVICPLSESSWLRHRANTSIKLISQTSTGIIFIERALTPIISFKSSITGLNLLFWVQKFLQWQIEVLLFCSSTKRFVLMFIFLELLVEIVTNKLCVIIIATFDDLIDICNLPYIVINWLLVF
jgi:hypothetical protein